MKDSWHLKERRRYPRIRVNYTALCTTTECGTLQQDIAIGRVIDISAGGVKMGIDSDVRVGTEIRMRIATQDSFLDVAGRVVRSLPGGDEKQILGIELSESIKDLCIEA